MRRGGETVIGENQLAQHPNGQTCAYRWVIMLVAIFSTNIFTVAFQAVPPVLPQLMDQFSISAVQAGLLISIAVVPGLFLSLPSAWLFNRYHARRAGVLASFCIAVACFVTVLSNSFEWLLLGRFLLGIGGNIMHITTLGAVSQWFSRKELGKAMGILGASTPIVTIITYSAVSLAATSFSWQFPFYISFLLAIFGLVVIAVAMKESPFCEEKVLATGVRNDYLNLSLWKVAIVGFCINVAASSFSMWAPTLYTQFTNMQIVEASLLASLSILPTVLFNPFFGFLSDKMGKRRLFIVLGPLLTTFSFVALAFGPVSAVFSSVLFMGIATTVASPIINAMPAEILGCRKAGVGIGLIAVFGALSAVFAGVVIGYIVDVSSSLTVSLLGMSAFSAVAFAVALTLKTK
ncbi:MAG: MFS transporter [Candidatus Bathyarchaeia archaeon]